MVMIRHPTPRICSAFNSSDPTDQTGYRIQHTIISSEICAAHVVAKNWAYSQFQRIAAPPGFGACDQGMNDTDFWRQMGK